MVPGLLLGQEDRGRYSKIRTKGMDEHAEEGRRAHRERHEQKREDKEAAGELREREKPPATDIDGLQLVDSHEIIQGVEKHLKKGQEEQLLHSNLRECDGALPTSMSNGLSKGKRNSQRWKRTTQPKQKQQANKKNLAKDGTKGDHDSTTGKHALNQVHDRHLNLVDTDTPSSLRQKELAMPLIPKGGEITIPDGSSQGGPDARIPDRGFPTRSSSK